MNWTIPIYEQERKLGLAEIIEASSAIAYASPVNNAEKIKRVLRRPTLNRSDKDGLELALATNLDQADLYYFASILVTTNWNKNDDVFGRKQVWAARKTPEDKPINIEHRHDQIVGHITNVVAIDAADFSIIPDDTEFDNLPESFHLLTGGVLYKYWKTDELRERIGEIFDKIEAKEEFVSMEVLFKDFDYAIKRADGSMGVVERNEETSFLTKHLRAYKGTGTYDGMRIGRYPKDLIFSGKGLTTNPANSDENGPISVIFDTEKFDELFVEQSVGAIMSKDLEAQVKELSDKLAKAEADYKTVVEAVATKDAKIVELETAVKGTKELVEQANASKTEVEKNFEAKVKEYNELSAKQVKTERISTLIAAGHSKADAEAFVEKFVGLNDDMFGEVAKLNKPAKTETQTTEASEEETETSLEKVEEKEVVLNDTQASKDMQLVHQAIASFFNCDNKEE